MKMDVQKSIMKNASIMFVAQLITWASSFVLLLFLPRYLGSMAYGHLFLAISLTMILSVVVDFGGSFLIPKNISRSPDDAAQILSSYLGSRAIIWFLGIVILLIFSKIAGYSSVVIWLIIIMGIAKLWEEIRKVYRSYFQGVEKMEYPSIGLISEKLFISIFAVGALLMGYQVITVAFIMATGALIDLLLCMIFANKFIDHLPRFNWKESIKLLKTGIPYFLWAVFSIIYFRIDAVMLSLMVPGNIVGWYGGAYRFFDIFMFFPSILTTVIFPILSKLSVKEENEMVQIFHKGIKYLLMSGLLVGILVFYFSPQIVALFLGLKGYRPSIVILQIFAVGVPFVYVDFILGNAILATDKQRKWAVVGFIAIGVNLLLNYFLIGYAQTMFGNGGLGAAIATIFTEIYIMSSAFILLPNRYFKGFGVFNLLKILTAAGVGASVLWILHTTDLFWIIQAILCVISYSIILILLNVITASERNSLLAFISANKLKSLITNKG